MFSTFSRPGPHLSILGQFIDTPQKCIKSAAKLGLPLQTGSHVTGCYTLTKPVISEIFAILFA
jgi:hypothetical protein